MRKRGLSCRRGVRLSVCHVGILYLDGEVIVKLLSRPGSPIILVFLTRNADT